MTTAASSQKIGSMSDTSCWARGAGVAEQAASESLVADPGVDEVAPGGAEDAGGLGAAVRDPDHVRDGDQVLERDAEDPLVDRAVDRVAGRVVVEGGDVSRPRGGA